MGVIFAWFMDEVVQRVLVCTPARRKMIAHMDRVRAQDVRLTGTVHPLHRRRWLKP